MQTQTTWMKFFCRCTVIKMHLSLICPIFTFVQVTEVSSLSQVVGIITRHDLTHERLHELRHQKKIRERATQRANRRLRRNRRKRGGYSGFSNPQDLMA